jgi:hypothetical protein
MYTALSDLSGGKVAAGISRGGLWVSSTAVAQLWSVVVGVDEPIN